MSKVYVNDIHNKDGTQAITIDINGNVATSLPTLAKVIQTSDQLNLTDQTWNKIKWDSALIDTKSGFDNANDTYIIRVDGYYRIYCQAYIGVDGESGSLRDSGLCITRTRAGTVTHLAFTMHDWYNGSTDLTDSVENAYVIDNCQVGDIIEFYSWGNSDTNNPYDVFHSVDASGDNTHMNIGLPGGEAFGDPISYFTIERIT